MVNKDFQAELIWKEKYEKVEVGNKKPIDKVSLPFQKVETIGKSRQKTLFSSDKNEDWTNKIIWGDNKYVLASLINGDPSIGLESMKGKIKLIYIDPPFFTGSNVSITIKAHNGDNLTKAPSITEEVAYRNIWSDGLNSFCQWMYERLLMMKDLLSEDGNIYVRFDYHYSHYVKLILDEVFGKENFRNEIIVNRTRKNVMESQLQKVFPTATDSLFFYSKGESYKLYETKKKLDETRKGFWRHMDDSSGKGSFKIFFGKKLTPPAGKHFKYSQEKIDDMIGNGKLRLKCKNCGNEHTKGEWKKCSKCKKDNPKPEYWVEPTETTMLDTNWTDIPGYSFSTGYPTENSEQLLDRVINACSKEGDIVADFFGGSGTTAAVAEKLGRRWIIGDIGKFSIHTMRKRILDIDVKKHKVVRRPFEILNLGKYERQQWQLDTLGKDQLDYIKFIAELYHAKFLESYRFLHGKIGDRMVHVGAIDSPITWTEIKDCLEECKTYKIKKLDILGWEFENGLHTLIEDEAKSSGVDLALRQIPREVMDKRAVESGDIKFFELAYLDVNVTQKKNSIKIKLKNFMIPNPELIPDEAKENIKNFTDYIDYWSLDWNFKEDTFHNEWQTFRTKGNKNLEIESEEHTYSKKGTYKIMVKVVDIFGNDTTKIIEVEIK